MKMGYSKNISSKYYKYRLYLAQSREAILLLHSCYGSMWLNFLFNRLNRNCASCPILLWAATKQIHQSVPYSILVIQPFGKSLTDLVAEYKTMGRTEVCNLAAQLLVGLKEIHSRGNSIIIIIIIIYNYNNYNIYIVSNWLLFSHLIVLFYVPTFLSSHQ